MCLPRFLYIYILGSFVSSKNISDNDIKQATTIFTTLVIKDTSVESHVHKRNRKQEN